MHRIWRNPSISFHPYIEVSRITTNMCICFVLLRHFLSSLPISFSYTYESHLSWHVLSFQTLSFSHSGGNFGGISFVPLGGVANKIYRWKDINRHYYKQQRTTNVTTNTKIRSFNYPVGSPLRFILNENGKELNGPLLDDVGPGNGGKGPQLNPAGTGRAVDGAPGDLLGLGAGVCCLLPDSRSRCACECVGVGDSGDSVLVTSKAGRLHFGVSIELPGVELLRLNAGEVADSMY